MQSATSDVRRMADRIANHDWASTPLGAIGGWPQSLKTAVDIMLGSGHAMQLAWGPGRTVLYNDAYAPMLGNRHPGALGLPFREAWPDIWDEIEPLVAQVFAGETVRFESMPLVLTRNGYPEDTWWNFSCSPVRDESGAVAGLLNVTVDATARMQAERAEAAVRKSEARLQLASEVNGLASFIWYPDEDRIEFNERLVQLFGLSEDADFNLEKALEYFHPDFVEPYQEAVAALLDPGNSDKLHGDALIIRPDGEERWLENTAQKYFEGGEVRVVGTVVDITERKRAEEALREREERQAFLLKLSDALRAESSADAMSNRAIGMLSEHMRLDRCYIAVYRLADDRADITHQVGNDRVPPMPEAIRLSDFPEAFRVTFDRTLVINDVAETAGLSDTDRRNIDALGLRALVAATLREGTGENSPLWMIVAVSARARRWTLGEIALIEEVTERTWAAIERVQAESALQASETRAQLALDAVGMGTSVWEIQQDRAEPDARFLALFNLPPDGVLSQQAVMGDMLHPDDADRYAAAVAEATRPGGPAELREDIRVRRGDGGWRWLAVTGRTVFDEAGRPLRMHGTALDITEQKATEARLRESEERQQFLLKLSDALRDARASDGVAGAATRMLAEHLNVDRSYLCTVSRKDALAWISNEYHAPGLHPIAGEFRFDDFPESMRGSETEALAIDDLRNDDALSARDKQSIAAMGMNAVLTGILRRDDRDQVWALVVGHSSAHAWSDTERMTVEETTERTWAAIERARAEEALQDNQRRLEDANRAKDRFLAMLGHELRNPLAPIVTTLELMKLRAPNSLKHEREVIASQVHTLVDMVDDLLDVARIARGDLKLDKHPLRIAEVVAEAASTAAWALTEYRQSLHVNVDPGLTVLGDRRRLVQVVVNLLVNAAKYSPPERRIDVDAMRDAEAAVIRVRDQGLGMGPELQSRVFEAFIQAEQSLDRRRGGLGLGLAIVHNIVALHDGSVTAASDGAGKGSEFTVRLPLLQGIDEGAPGDAAISAAPAQSGGAATRVLLVDDHVAGAQAMGALLEAMGYAVHIEHDGPAALAAAKACRPAIALLDIGLPGMDGYELARALRAAPESAKLPLVALTGYGQAEDRARTRDAGFDEHVTKPVGPSNLVALIEKLVHA